MRDEVATRSAPPEPAVDRALGRGRRGTPAHAALAILQPALTGCARVVVGREELLAGVAAGIAFGLLVFVLTMTVWLAIPLSSGIYLGLLLLRPDTRGYDAFGESAPSSRAAIADTESAVLPMAELAAADAGVTATPSTPAESLSLTSADCQEKWRRFAATYGLTKREAEVVKDLAPRLTDREIADRLSISPRTVEKHVDSALGKLGLESRREVAAFLKQHGLTQPQDDQPAA